MPLKVLMADDQTAHWGSLKTNWERALGGGVEIDMLIDLPSVQTKLSTRPHIVILDNQFSLSTNEGATFIARNKQKYPDTVFVLMTGQSFDIEQLGQRTPNPDFIVPKPYLLVEGYRAYIGKAVRSAVGRSPGSVSTPVDGLNDIGVTREAFTSLVEQCLSNLELLDFDIKSEPISSFRLLSGGFSGAAVYQMELRGAGKTPSLPLVLKCGGRQQIGREIGAFERWVRWQIPHDLRVDVIGRGVTQDHAAVCYGFVLGSSSKLSSLSEEIKSLNFDLVSRTLKRIFLAERTGWYRPTVVADRSLGDYLLNRFEFDPAKDERRNRKLRDTLTSISLKENFNLVESGGDLIIFGRNFGSIRKAVYNGGASLLRTAFCHGDLNANNIFVDSENNGLALIDFEQSGENQITRDLICAETSLRMDLPPSMTDAMAFEKLVTLEREFFESPPTGAPGSYDGWIAMIRHLSSKVYADLQPAEYRVPLVLHSWKVLGIKTWPPEVERRLSAAVLAGLEYLMRS